MGLKDDLESDVVKIFKTQWTTRDGVVVPEYTDIKLSNDGVDLDATILYADLDSSTSMVDTQPTEFSGEIYKTFLLCASKLIRADGGHIRSYDGDRVMGIFIGDSKNSDAAKCGLKINWAVRNIIQPKMKAQYPNQTFQIKHIVGIDTSKVRAIRTGVRGDNDIAWVGRAPNYAAKLCSLNDDNNSTWITEAVYNRLKDESKYSNGVDMWQKRSWTQMGGKTVYCSSYWWSVA